MFRKTLKIIIISLSLQGIFCANWVFAEARPLQIYALNAGYKDDNSAQNFDFIELRQISEGPLSLEGFKLLYYNSVGNLAGEIDFSEYVLVRQSLVLYFSKSPQATGMPEEYLYGFSSSGIASTAGHLQLMMGDELLDEICWGKNVCENFYGKFATSQEDNLSIRRNEEDVFVAEKYYPDSSLEALTLLHPEPVYPPCENLIITEYRSYTDQPFIEIYNTSSTPQDISGCQILYKNMAQRLEGTIEPGAYYASYDIKLSKNPSSKPLIRLVDDNGSVIDSVEQSGNQRAETSMALLADAESMIWKRTYQPTPGAENIDQIFRSCPEGKVINLLTGNCVKEESSTSLICPEGKYLNVLTGRCKTIEKKKEVVCKEGYYLNILTGRCKKVQSSTELKACSDGYERNPETNRCRKIAKNSGEEYPVTPTEESTIYENPKIFTATAAIIALIILAIVCVCIQFRKEIKKRIIRLWRRKKS